MTVNELIGSFDEEVLNYNGVMLIIPIQETINEIETIGDCHISDFNKIKIDVSSLEASQFELYSNYGIDPIVNEETFKVEVIISQDGYLYVYDRDNKVYVVY